MQEVTLRQPDDWHVHLRDGSVLEAVLPYTARQFARAIIMPNLSTPVTTRSQAAGYRRRILQALPEDASTARFMPLMTAYLTDEIQVGELLEGFQDGVFHAAKLYPANATTNSSQGVTDINKLAPVFRKMQEIGMPLLIHGEVTNPDVDIFDREAIFIRDVLKPLINEFSGDHPTIQWMGLLNINATKFSVIFHLFINFFQAPGLFPERGSGIRTKDKSDRLAAGRRQAEFFPCLLSRTR